MTGAAPGAPDDLYLGLLSGTSADAVDAALVRIGATELRLVAAASTPYPSALRQRVLAVAEAARVEPEEIGELDRSLGMLMARAASELLAAQQIDPARVRAIGSHGQTIRHRPARPGYHGAGFSWQIGDPNTIAELTGVCTVADFRRRDIAAGGQGAPLVPAFHAFAFGTAAEDGAVLNIGGMANLTLLPAAGEVSGFDTGPGNALLDAWTLRHLGRDYDDHGTWARSGRVDPGLLQDLLAHSFLALAPPKSTGREEFNLSWLDTRLAGRALQPADVQTSLLEYTARSIADALAAYLPGCRRLHICGGGVHNDFLMERLGSLVAAVVPQSTERLGIHPDWVEACLFAWLARCALEGIAGNLPAVTGAARRRCLGGIYPAR